MAVVASVHVADVGVASALKVLRRVPRPGSIDGLRHAEVGSASPLRQSTIPRPAFGRVALIGFWDDDDALGRAKPFHHREAFVRFRPYAVEGRLEGKNPLPEWQFS